MGKISARLTANEEVYGKDCFPLFTTCAARCFAGRQIKQTLDNFDKNGIAANYFGGL